MTGNILGALRAEVHARGWTDRRWAGVAGVRHETLSRVLHRGHCDTGTLEALTRACGFALRVGSAAALEADASGQAVAGAAHDPPAAQGAGAGDRPWRVRRSTACAVSAAADPAFVQALGEIAARIAATLKRADRALLPVKMFLAGGAAVHLYTGARSTGDVDAGFSKRLLPPEDLDVTYVDAKGETRLLYFDRQYTADAVHHRALEALGGYIGNSERVRGSIGLAEQLIARAAAVR